MASLAVALLDLRDLDRLALQDTPLHRLDPKAKVLATTLFLITLASFDRHEVSGLLSLALFPVVLATFGGVPLGLLGRKVLLAWPFVLLLGAFLPFLDTGPGLRLGPLSLSAGWIAFASLLLRGTLAVATATVLVAVTGFGDMCAALDRLGLPRAFVQQLLFLYRYLFVVGEEARRSLLARELRAHGHPMTWRDFPSFAGHLLLRSWERAERVHAALLARGFQGTLPARVHAPFGVAALAFVLGWATFFALCRLLPLPRLLGTFLAGVAS